MNEGYETQQYQDSFAPSYMQQQDSALIKWQLDPEDILDQIEHKLKGEVYVDTDGPGEQPGRWIQKYTPLLNNHGVNGVLATTSALLTKVIILSNFETEDINKMAMKYGFALVDLFSLKYNDYEIDLAQMSLIVNLLVNTFYATLKRAEKGGEREFLKGTQRYIESHISRPNEYENKKGLFSGLFRV